MLTKIDYNIDGISELGNSFAKCMNVFGNCIIWTCKCIKLVVSVKEVGWYDLYKLSGKSNKVETRNCSVNNIYKKKYCPF